MAASDKILDYLLNLSFDCFYFFFPVLPNLFKIPFHLLKVQEEKVQEVIYVSNPISTFEGSHPPTSLRIQMLKQFPTQIPSLMVDQSLMHEINRELSGLKSIIQARLVDHYRDSLYYR